MCNVIRLFNVCVSYFNLHCIVSVQLDVVFQIKFYKANTIAYWHYWPKRSWRCQRVNQNLYIEERPTTQWPNEKWQNGKQRSTKHTHKTKDRVTWTPLIDRMWTHVLPKGRHSSCNTMAKRKRSKRQTTIYKALHRKLKIKQHTPH